MSEYEKLTRSVPAFVREDPIMQAFYAAVAPEIEAAGGSVDELPAQIWPHLVTWGVARLERIFGIQVDPMLPLAARRSALVAKLRSTGASSLPQIKAIADSYASGAVSINERYSDYTVEIEFIDEFGVPLYLESLKKALRASVPAHLVIEFVLRWLSWGELKESGMTWGQLKADGITWEQLKSYDIV